MFVALSEWGRVNSTKSHSHQMHASAPLYPRPNQKFGILGIFVCRIYKSYCSISKSLQPPSTALNAPHPRTLSPPVTVPPSRSPTVKRVFTAQPFSCRAARDRAILEPGRRSRVAFAFARRVGHDGAWAVCRSVGRSVLAKKGAT